MPHPRNRTNRNRGKGARKLTIREIKTAICTHARVAPAGPAEPLAEWDGWQITLVCPSCGLSSTSVHGAGEQSPAVVAARPATDSLPSSWEECAIELQCSDGPPSASRLCRFEAVIAGRSDRSVTAMSETFHAGAAESERAAILTVLANEMASDRWEPLPGTGDGLLRFQRRATTTPVAVVGH
jgi:hypothetical protein